MWQLASRLEYWYSCDWLIGSSVTLLLKTLQLLVSETVMKLKVQLALSSSTLSGSLLLSSGGSKSRPGLWVLEVMSCSVSMSEQLEVGDWSWADFLLSPSPFDQQNYYITRYFISTVTSLVYLAVPQTPQTKVHDCSMDYLQSLHPPFLIRHHCPPCIAYPVHCRRLQRAARSPALCSPFTARLLRNAHARHSGCSG